MTKSPFKKSQALHRKSVLLGFKHDCNQDKVGSDLVNATVSEFIQSKPAQLRRDPF